MDSLTHVLFDFFGTLVDYAPGRLDGSYERSFSLLERAGTPLDPARLLASWNQTFARFEARAVETHREFSMDEVCAAFLRDALPGPPPPDLVREFACTYVAEWNECVQDKPGVPELLERLARRFTLAIVTNTHEPDLVPGHLRRLGLSARFAHVVTSVELGTRKPAPGIFAHTLERLAAAPGRCVFVGDSYDADYLGARSAGMRAFLIDPLAKAPVPDEARLASLLELEGRLAGFP